MSGTLVKSTLRGQIRPVNGIEAGGSMKIVERLTMSMLDGETHGESMLDQIQSQMVRTRIPERPIYGLMFQRRLSTEFFSRESAP